jgi:hypothetical protein
VNLRRLRFAMDRSCAHTRAIRGVHESGGRPGAFASYFITAGLDGALLVTAASENAHAFARFLPADFGVTLTGLYFGEKGIFVPAHTDRWATTYVAREPDGSGRIKQLVEARESNHHDSDDHGEEGDNLPLADARAMF